MISPRDVISQLYELTVLHRAYQKGEPVPKHVLDVAVRLRDLSRIRSQVQLASMSDLENLIQCLASLENGYSELESLLTIAIFNTCLQNRGLLLQLTMSDQIDYYDLLLNRLLDSCTWQILQKQPSLVVPKTVFDVLDFMELSGSEFKVLHTVEERDLTLPKLKLLFLLLSHKVPGSFVSIFIETFFPRIIFTLSIFLMDIVEDSLEHGLHDCKTMVSLAPVFTELFKVWYAFSCNYEEIVWSRSIHEGWVHKMIARWTLLFEQVAVLVPFCFSLLQKNKFYTMERAKMKCALSLTNVMLLPNWEIYRSWIITKGIEIFYTKYIFDFILLEGNLSRLDMDKLYTNSTESFSFVNLDILPLVSLLNRFLDISNRYDKEVNDSKPNYTRKIFNYAFSGRAQSKAGNPKELGISQVFIDLIPNLRPYVEMLLQEPLMVKLNKEFLQIYTRLDIQLFVPKQAPYFVNQRANSGDWNLMAVNMASLQPGQTISEEERDDLKMKEANLIFDQIEKVSTKISTHRV